MTALLIRVVWLALWLSWTAYGVAGAGNVVAVIVWFGLIATTLTLLMPDDAIKRAFVPKVQGPLSATYKAAVLTFAGFAIWQGHATGAAMWLWALAHHAGCMRAQKLAEQEAQAND